MGATKTLVKAIKEWDKSRNTEVNDLVSILRRTLHKLGAKVEIKEADSSKLFDELQERVLYLTESESMREEFLVISSVRAITELLEETIKYHGHQIVANEQVLNDLRNEGESAEDIENVLKELKDRDRNFKVTSELDRWKAIVAEKFSSTKRMLWRKDKTENTIDDLLNPPQEVEEIIKDVPLRELIEHMPLNNLDAAKAKEIRKQWLKKKDK